MRRILGIFFIIVGGCLVVRLRIGLLCLGFGFYGLFALFSKRVN